MIHWLPHNLSVIMIVSEILLVWNLLLIIHSLTLVSWNWDQNLV